jgi:hypothetical protein
MSRLNFHVNTFSLRGEPVLDCCPDCGGTRNAPLSMPDLVNAVMAKMPNATDATRAKLRAMSRSDLEALAHGLHANSGPTLRTHSQQHSRVESIPAEQLEAMAGGLSSFRANKRIGDGTPQGGVIHGRYQPAPAPSSLHAYTRAEDIPPEQLAAAPKSSFRPNAHITGANRGGEFRSELAEELHTHGMLPSSFVRNPRIRRAS